MQKEMLTLLHIKEDLGAVVRFRMARSRTWRLPYIVNFALLSVLLALLFGRVWLTAVAFAPAVYHIIRYAIEMQAHRTVKKEVMAIADRDDVSISVETFSHIAKETVYEPHGQGLEIHLRKTVYDYTFSSGRRWRVPEPTVRKHYAWSKECGVSNKGLEQISVSGNTFYFISLQSDQEISYIYPCKLFTLDQVLQEGL